MNLINIAKHLLYLTEREFDNENSTTTADEIFASEQLFEVLKSFKDSHFSELDVYQTLDLDDEYDDEEFTNEEEYTDTKENVDDNDDYDENQQLNIINNHFTLEEMENIVEWVDQRPNYKFTTIKHKFRKVKYPYYISRFREYIKNNGTKFEKLEKFKEFMWD
ncbi:unnamed protein product [Rotaria sordida]|uniref:Uncharacterized protein n=1 Tax=Rotaria sordida TaxID=392033 RepID=A0A815R159_9BILA|nr:unnamed protein product [Rotaria sordida]CAF4129757.1 unnamed protein product [Rotaria sordida]